MTSDTASLAKRLQQEAHIYVAHLKKLQEMRTADYRSRGDSDADYRCDLKPEDTHYWKAADIIEAAGNDDLRLENERLKDGLRINRAKWLEAANAALNGDMGALRNRVALANVSIAILEEQEHE